MPGMRPQCCRRSLPLALLASAFMCLVAPAGALDRGQLPPEIGLSDRAGKVLRVQSLRGSVVVVDFFASWCGPCRQELPVWQHLYEKYKAMGLVVVGINLDEDAGAMTSFLATNPVTFPVVRDTKLVVVKRYAPPRMPTSYLFGRDGKLDYVHLGFRASDGNELEQRIKALLAAADPGKAESPAAAPSLPATPPATTAKTPS